MYTGDETSFCSLGENGTAAMRGHGAIEDVVYEDIDMDLEDSDFEPGADRELLGLFFPEVSIKVVKCQFV